MESCRISNVLSRLVAAGCVVFAVGCASIATESGYVFDPADAVDNPFPTDPFCTHVRNYKDGEPAYHAEYRPEADLVAHLQMVAPRQNNHHSVGPGVLVPLPVIPDPAGNTAATYYRDAPERQFEVVKVAVYPAPFKPGYFFTPSQTWLETDGKVLHPVSITRHYTVNRAGRQQKSGILRDKLPAHSGEFNAYILEFDVKDVASATVNLHVAGFEHNGTAVPAREFQLSANQSQVFDWKYDMECGF